MSKRIIVYKVTAVVDVSDEVSWKVAVRAIRSKLKEVINSLPNTRAAKIESEEVK